MMNNCKKMVLIDQQTLDRLGKAPVNSLQKNELKNTTSTTDPIKGKIIALRNEMKQILRLKNMDTNEKLSRYQETLRRYLDFISIDSSKINEKSNKTTQSQFEEKLIPTKLKQEIIDDQQDESPTNASADVMSANINSEDERSKVDDDDNLLKLKLLLSVPEKKRDTARELYTILYDSKLIDWDATGTVRMKGLVIDDSSIIDLISDVLSNRQTSNPSGWKDFSTILEELKIPMKYISNIRHKKFIRSNQSEVVSSPIKSAEKRKKRKLEDLSPSQGVKRAKRRSARVLATGWKRFNF